MLVSYGLVGGHVVNSGMILVSENAVAMEIFKLAILMFYQENWPKKPQTKHVGRMILPVSSQKYL